jgi:biopolymer transport protein ExbB/TolQ
MAPITLLLLVDIGIVLYIIFSRIRKKEVSQRLMESVKHVGGLAAAFGTLGTLASFFMAFNALETSKEIIGFQMIMGGLKVALITVIYGLLVFCLSLGAYILLKVTTKNSAQD